MLFYRRWLDNIDFQLTEFIIYYDKKQRHQNDSYGYFGTTDFTTSSPTPTLQIVQSDCLCLMPRSIHFRQWGVQK